MNGKQIKEKALSILSEYGAVILVNEFGECKAVHNERDLKAALKLADKGVIDRFVDAK